MGRCVYRVCSLGANGEGEDDFAEISLSIHEVAQRCGFPDSDYFCRSSGVSLV